MQIPLSDIAMMVRKQRIDLGLSQRQVARSVNCSQSYIAQVEAGTRPISRNLAEQLEKLFKLRKGSYTKHAVFVRGRPRKVRPEE